MTKEMKDKASEISFNSFIKSELDGGADKDFISMLAESEYFKEMWDVAFRSGCLFSEMLQERESKL